jgi:hypothetical protein
MVKAAGERGQDVLLKQPALRATVFKCGVVGAIKNTHQ